MLYISIEYWNGIYPTEKAMLSLIPYPLDVSVPYRPTNLTDATMVRYKFKVLKYDNVKTAFKESLLDFSTDGKETKESIIAKYNNDYYYYDNLFVSNKNFDDSCIDTVTVSIMKNEKGGYDTVYSYVLKNSDAEQAPFD